MQQTESRFAHLQWDDVRLFLALCRAPTLGAAARGLKVDISTVSRRLAALEETLGASLFDRGRSGVVATPAVEALLPVAEEIEHAMARFAGAAEAIERDVKGLVRIACPPDAAEVMIVPHLTELFARYPGLQVELAAGEGLVDVSRRAADIAVRIVRPERGDLLVRTIGTVDWALVASPELAKVIGTVRRYRDLPWITFGEGLSHIPAARWVQDHAEVEPRLCSDSIRVQIAAVAQGLGVAWLPGPSTRHYSFVPLKISRALRAKSQPLPEENLFLVTHRALRPVPRVRAVWDFLLDVQARRS